jgi:hypothetical protein
MLMHCDILSSYNVNDRAKSVVFKTLGYEYLHVTVILAVLAVGSKLLLHVILNHKTMPKEQLPRGITVRSHPQGWITNKLIKNWVVSDVEGKAMGTPDTMGVAGLRCI